MRLDHITSSVFDTSGYVRQQNHITENSIQLGSRHVTTRRQPRYVHNLLRNTERESVRVLPAKNRQRCEPSNRLPGDHSVVEPPDPIPNSEVKRNRADGSVAQAMQE